MAKSKIDSILCGVAGAYFVATAILLKPIYCIK